MLFHAEKHTLIFKKINVTSERVRRGTEGVVGPSMEAKRITWRVARSAERSGSGSALTGRGDVRAAGLSPISRDGNATAA